MTAPKIDRKMILKYQGKELDASGNNDYFITQVTALKLFNMDDMYNEKAYYSRNGFGVCFLKEQHPEYENRLSFDEHYIIERYDHRKEVREEERSNRVIFYFERGRGYRFLGEYQLLTYFPALSEESHDLSIWKRINKKVKTLI